MCFFAFVHFLVAAVVVIVDDDILSHTFAERRFKFIVCLRCDNENSAVADKV